MLTAEQAVLWQKILDFQLDDPEAAFKFSERLARENGWNIHYALRVIAEYRKFIFLCCISDKGVTPSDAVDQAWHLHLTFTRSYWIDLCRDALGRELHHNPTKGGTDEANKYDEFYIDTSYLYYQFFGELLPADIWPDNAKRFTDIDFERVNKRRNWIIRKPRSNKVLSISLFWTFAIFIMALKGGNGDLLILSLLAFLVVLLIAVFKWERGGGDYSGDNNSSGCGTTGANVNDGCNSGHHGHSEHGCHSGCSGHSGCGSGCSGCSSSGCSSGH
ncbi:MULTISPECIES: glycine-rich domain-containing protein [Mucilaginibacter]|uniref:TIGR04222 domain-containing membrane protein n=1 Tax=Mucilaginibacter rubeus TaxID=2027860 RepID=A0ABX7UG14_9SPHI|nr:MULTISPECIES: hypothetical protein [Mucilaginibacter]QTE44941.1 hypothetical protein J3L19_06140 [Mucilaginibacter rubeus]QTE51538.1 hypothetical protein J3L21_06115 [Mucilaginibacter rubeus]QTE56625.1 hypothetical protein J3L23_31355 [Mucilaginibacter rubeus]QTE63912.1 hypothetical protein J3L22_02470 [Mucilaginibacter rubeus]QTF62673.1 hypothetical protein J3L20_02150 [Mucilaginibacter rubeus]